MGTSHDSHTSSPAYEDAPPGERAAVAAETEQRSRSRGLLGGVVAIVLVAGVVLSGGLGAAEPVEIAPVAVDGAALEPLRRLEDGDPAVGRVAPSLHGVDQAGRSTSLTPGEGPVAVIFVAHWCAYCQQEVPEIQAIAATDGLPEGVEVLMVVTDTTSQRENYPPSAWLEAEGWTAPVIMDDGAGVAAASYGVNGFPFHVFLDRDGRVLGRIAGAVGAEGYTEILGELAGR